jgi:hypothetical protein
MYFYALVYVIRRKEASMAIARIFKSGNSQAVRLPKEFRFHADQVEITRRGDEIICGFHQIIMML